MINNNIIYFKYLKIDDLIKILKYIDYSKEYKFLIERLYNENLIKTSDLIYLNILKNNLKTLEIVKKYKKLNDISEEIIDFYVSKNDKICLQFIIENKKQINKTEWPLKNAIIHNCYECFIYLLKNGYIMEESVFYYILKYDRILFLKYLYENKYNIYYEENINYCCKADTMNCLIYLIESNKIKCNWNVTCSYSVVKKNNLDYLKYIILCGCPINEYTFSYCVDYSDLELVKYLVSINCPFNIDAMNNAIENNDLICIKYLRSINCPWNETSTATACEYGNYNILKYLIKNGCKVDDESLYYSSKNGKIECLLYLVNKGLKLNKTVFTNLINFGNLDYLKIVYNLNCQYDSNISLSNALFTKNNDIILFLYNNGFRCNGWVNKTNVKYLEKLLIKNNIKLKDE